QGGGDGSLLITRDAAAGLGLERRSAVAGFAPVRVDGARPWSVAVVASAMNVRDRAKVGAWRLVAATAFAALLVGSFAFLRQRQERRAQSLAGALRLAEATAGLRERSEKIVEAIPLGVMSLDGGGRVTSANPWLFARGVRPGGPLAQALAAAL